ncbi:discoidin domain-containing protein [Prevotella jejuni]
MKINVFKSVLAASLVAATLASCQSEPEVGSLLYPSTEENYSAKAFLYAVSTDGNKLALAGEKSASAVTLAGDSATFYVRLSSPAEKDVTVTLAASSDGVTAGNDEVVMGTEAVSLSKTSVTIAKGQTESEPIVVKLVNGDVLKNMPMLKNGVTSIVMKSVDGVQAASTNTSVLVATNFTFNNINASGTLNADKQIALNEYQMSTTLSSSNAAKLNDGDNNTYVYSYTYYEPEFTMAFNSTKELIGVGILCNYTSYGYGVKKVAVATSLDGKTWTNMGTATAASTYDDDTPFPIVFNTPVTCKFVKLTILQSFDESENPRFLIGEIGAYEYLDWSL